MKPIIFMDIWRQKGGNLYRILYLDAGCVIAVELNVNHSWSSGPAEFLENFEFVKRP